MRFSFLLVFIAIFYCTGFYAQVKDEADLKKQAEKYFEDEDYNLAYKLFAQLVSLYPKDPDYNYKLGVCMLYTEPDKKKPYSYLLLATKNPTDAPKDAKFYLAKTYHVNYKFDEAIKLYTEYKTIGSSASIKRLQVDREIQACKNGKRLLSNLTDLVVISKKQLSETNYYNGYDVKEIGGKLLVKPDEYNSAYDKKKKNKSVVYLPRNGERLYYSSYGEGGGNGRDIYYVNKLPNGGWSKATMMPTSINTEFDEDYPFLHPNGKTLYFSSKGHNSMGGYDVFKTTYNDDTQSWSKPENLEFPINSPDDDILFVTDSLEKTAYFSTGRYSPYGKLDVLKINTERRPMNFAVMKGTVVKEEASQSIKSKITVKNMANGEIVGTFQAGENGDYNMELPNGGKFIFTVETPGIPTQSDGVQIPLAYTLKPYKQVISYDKKILKIINYFDGAVSDENYSMMIDLIEKKAKLEVNENDPYNSNLLKDANKNQTATNTNDLNSVSTTNPTVAGGNDKNPTTVNTNKNVTNEQLLSIAKMDSKEASDEAIKLKKEAQDAFGLATQKTAESVAIQKELDEAIEKSNSITDVAKKNEELTKINQLKDDAKIASNVANTATNLAKKLEVDASIQQKEADLTNQYISQLETVIQNKNNKEALTKLESIQKELDDISKQKNQSDELFTSLKAESELKKQELISSEKKSNSIVNEINSIKTESENLEKDLANENDKSIKENISAQIRELTNEIDLKNKELVTNNTKIESLKNEVEGVNQELLIAAKILNESTEGITATTNPNTNNQNNSTSINSNPNSANTQTNSIAANNGSNNSTLSYQGISNKYNNQINSTSIDKTKKEDVVKQNEILKAYTKDVNDLIALNKNEITKTKDATEKKKLNDEIKLLEKQKTENEKAIVANNSAIKQLESNTIANNNVNSNENGTQINANNTGTNSANTSTIGNGNTNNSSVVTNTINNNSGNNTPTFSTSVSSNNENGNGSNTNSITANSTSTNSSSSNEITNNSAANKNGNNNTTDGNQNNTNSNETNTAINNSNGNSANNENNTAITTNAAGNNEVIKPINTAVGNDKEAFLNELSNLKNGLNSNSNISKQVFNYSPYLESTSTILKQTADNKFEIAKQNELNLASLISKTENSIKIASNNNAASLINEAEQLNNKAFEQRKESALKTGTEKENLLKLAIENEKASTDKKLEASIIQQKQNKAKFENNVSNLAELQKLNGDKTSNEISQANMLVDEAALNFKQAQKMRQEADAYPNGAAKLGGLSNAEEKENEALLKQQKALATLTKANPSFKAKTNEDGSNPSDAISNLNNEVAKISQLQADAYLALSKANQNELNLQIAKLVKNPTYKNPTNKAAQDLKTNADKLNTEAKGYIAKSLTASNATEKANLLLKANEKEIASLKSLRQAQDLLNGTAIAVNSNTPTTNTNTLSVNDQNSTNSTTDNNAISKNGNTTNTNTVAVNDQNSTNTTTDNNAINKNENTTNTNTVAVNDQNSTNTTTDNNAINKNGNTTNTNTVAVNDQNSTNTTIDNNAINKNGNTTSTNTLAVNDQNSTNTTKDNNAINQNSNSTGNGVGDEAKKLKAGLNNSQELSLINFNSYKNNEAVTLKDKASQQINEALTTDKKIESELDIVSQLASNKTNGNSIDQTNITSLLSEAEKLNDEAYAFRKSAATKIGEEKESDLTKAKSLEAEALGKKIEAADKQKQLNLATYEANKQSLEELTQLAKGKNIPELSSADMQINEASLFLKQSARLREEANAYPTDAAKLGGYSNAEEKEFQAIFKQQALLDLYKKTFPNYVAKKPVVASENPESVSKLKETKTSLNTNNQLHIDGLLILTQANEKEYQARFISLPANLNPVQTSLKSKAQASYKKNQDLTVKANQTTDINTKKKLLSEAAQAGQDAISLLNQIINPSEIAIVNSNANSTNSNSSNNATNQNSGTNNTINNNTTTNNTGNSTNNASNTTNNNASTNKNNTPTITLKVEGLDVKAGNAYTADKPIPIDEKIPDGLVFKVQIGAFKAPLPNSTFKGLTPVIAQTTPSGYIRYMAGNFEQYGSANAVKNDLRNLGYSDAFVVAYYNGKRINLNEATDKAKATGQTIEAAANTSAGITVNSNVPKNTFSAPNVNTNTTESLPAEITNELEKMNGLLYTVQIGVYSKQVTRSQLFNLKPIYTEKLPNGLYRYTAGIYNQSGKLLEDKRKVVNLGVKDAFVSSYYNAKRIPFAEGQKLQTENSNLKMETENPIIFGNSTSNIAPSLNATTVNTPTTTNTTLQPTVTNTPPTIAPFSNGVTTGPTPTAENGVKTDDVGVSFKVQIGAYKNQVPNDVASKFLNIKTWPVQNLVINSLYIYSIGNFTAASFAKKLKDEAVSVGITDAFITVYKDGKKLYGSEAAQYLAR